MQDFDTNWAGPEELKPRVYRTQSEKDTWMSVGVENEYELGPLQPDDVVIDIGAHIGSFSHLAYRMGSRSIYAFEIDPWHIEAAVKNIEGMEDGIALYHCAVVRGDEYRAKQYYYAGAWNSFAAVGNPVASLSLDEILEPHEAVRFLKMDCEGGEWPILYTCSQLSKVQEIVGEYHLDLQDAPEIRNLSHEIGRGDLVQFLSSQGFTIVDTIPADETIGHFRAARVRPT